MAPTLRAIRDYFIADTAVVTGDVVIGAGVNVWFGTVIRGDIARRRASLRFASSSARTPISGPWRCIRL